MKKFDLSSLSINTKTEIAGVWFDIGDGCKLKVARANNPEYVKLFNELIGPYRRMIASGALPESKQVEIAAEAISKTILLDWEGLYLDDCEVTYSNAAAEDILKEAKYNPFFTLVMSLAQSESAYREKEVATELGEPRPIFDGDLNGVEARSSSDKPSEDSE